LYIEPIVYTTPTYNDSQTTSAWRKLLPWQQRRVISQPQDRRGNASSCG